MGKPPIADPPPLANPVLFADGCAATRPAEPLPTPRHGVQLAGSVVERSELAFKGADVTRAVTAAVYSTLIVCGTGS